jgi:hypothetical protein
MKWVFINFTSYAADKKLCALFEILEGFRDLCETCGERVMDSAGWNRVSRRVTKAIFMGRRKCNRMELRGAGGEIAGIAIEQLRGQVVVTANAFCWDWVEPEAAFEAYLDGDKRRWEILMPFLGIQKLLGVEPSVCLIAMKAR